MFLRILHLAQAALAAYGGQQSYVAITNLQKYEETSEKLAKYSSEAKHQLHKTRTTQTSGAVAMLLSLFISLFLAYRGPSNGLLVRFFASPVVFAAVFFARAHIQEYWTGKDGKTVGTRMPLPKMGDYNEAQRKTEELLMVLEWMMMSWGLTSVVAIIGGY